MRFKLDENLDVRLASLLAQSGHDVATVLDQRLSGASDHDIFRAAVEEQRTLVTLDLDFSNPFRFPPAATAGVVVLRVPRPLLALVQSTVQAVLPQLTRGPIRGRLWIVEPGRIREYTPEPTGAEPAE